MEALFKGIVWSKKRSGGLDIRCLFELIELFFANDVGALWAKGGLYGFINGNFGAKGAWCYCEVRGREWVFEKL